MRSYLSVFNCIVVFVLFILVSLYWFVYIGLAAPGGIMKHIWCQLKLQEVESKSIWDGSVNIEGFIYWSV